MIYAFYFLIKRACKFLKITDNKIILFLPFSVVYTEAGK